MGRDNNYSAGGVLLTKDTIMLKNLTFIFALNCVFLGATVLSAQTSKITVTATGLRNADGKVLFSLYKSGDGFPSDATKALANGDTKIANGEAAYTFQGLKPGSYAVSILHDENNNGKMETNFFGIPKEGYGASNDAKGSMGPPKYEDAKLELKEAEKRISIKMLY